MGMKPEPCEFNSKELVTIAIQGLTNAMRDLRKGAHIALTTDQLQDVLDVLKQAEAQNEYNNGAATPFPEAKDPWAWENADTFGPSA